MADSDDTLQFSDYRTQVIGFTSTTSDLRQHNVRHLGVGTDPMPTTCEQGSSTNASLDIAVQTTVNSLLANTGAMPRVDEKKLHTALLRIYPIVEKELLLGPTPMTHIFSTLLSEQQAVGDWNALAHQVIELQSVANTPAALDDLTHGCAAWMSVGTQNAPILAVAGSFSHRAWCDHNDATVEVFVPRRHKDTGDIFYAHFRTLAAKSCVQCLETNPRNKDWLAAGSYSGDVCVWMYERCSSSMAPSHEDRMVQVACDEQSQFGCVVGLTWMRLPAKKGSADAGAVEHGLLSAHADGMVVMWRIHGFNAGAEAARMTREKIFSIKSTRNAKETARISAIIALTGDQFVVGTATGNVYLCSISQAIAVATAQPTTQLATFNPIIGELADAHRFAVTTLRLADEAKAHHSDGQPNPNRLLISADVSGEVFTRRCAVRDDADGSALDELIAEAPWQIIRMPMRLRHCVRVSRDGQRLLVAGADGAVEWYSVTGSPPRQLVPGKCSGSGGFVALSANESWIITGMYDGRTFQLFHVQT